MTPEQATKKGTSTRRRRPCGNCLLVKLLDLHTSLIQSQVLHQHRLCELVQGIRVAGKTIHQKRLGIRIFFRKRGLLDLCGPGLAAFELPEESWLLLYFKRSGFYV